MEITSFLAAYDALRSAQGSEEPTTKREAAALVKELARAVGPLSEWASEFESAIQTLEENADELYEADSDDRSSCHGELAGAAEDVIEALVDLGITQDTIENLRTTVS